MYMMILKSSLIMTIHPTPQNDLSFKGLILVIISWPQQNLKNIEQVYTAFSLERLSPFPANYDFSHLFVFLGSLNCK